MGHRKCRLSAASLRCTWAVVVSYLISGIRFETLNFALKLGVFLKCTVGPESTGETRRPMGVGASMPL